MIRNKLFIILLIITLILSLSTPLVISSCSCGVQGGIENEPPVITGLSVSPAIINPGANGTVIVTATDSSGDVLKYEWLISDGTINNDNKNETTFTAPFSTGIITITVRVSDLNDSIVQDSIQVTVAEGEMQNVGNDNEAEMATLNLYASPATVAIGSVGSIAIILSGYNGDISGLQYDCTISEGTIESINENEIIYTAPENLGTITIELTISDQSGEVATGSIQINVVQGNQEGQNEEVQSGVAAPAK